MKPTSKYILSSIFNSYSIVFFSHNRALAVMLLLVSFFNPVAGLTGLLSLLMALSLAWFGGYNRDNIALGIYSFNALLLGIGFGTFYEMNLASWILLAVACTFTVLFSVVLSGWLGKYGLPFLSIPFVLSFWLVLLPAGEFTQLGLSQRSIYWLNEMYATGGHNLVNFVQYIENWPMPAILAVFFRSFSAIFFQSSLLAGLIMSIGLLIHSRIAFTLLVIGFLTAYGFNHLVGAYGHGINYYNLGSNFMMASMAIGGFFLVPSIRSYAWAVWSMPLAYLLVLALTKIGSTWNLPVFSLPFCIVVIALLYYFTLRSYPGRLQLTPTQYYSPELNLYQYENGKERLQNLNYFRLYPPFIGEWAVSQGYDGSITHKGDWSKALDFVILDKEMKTYANPGRRPEDFYCFNKPVLACGDGIIEEVIDHVADNEIGKVNTAQNWGNSIVIRHAVGLYSKVSHLKNNSIRVKPGDFVHRGEMIAMCGNSGRSPEPHLHFQVQATPYVGSKTLDYPLAYFTENRDDQHILSSFSIPQEGALISPVETDPALRKAFAFPPGYQVSFRDVATEAIETWEVFTNAFNQTYIYCKSNGATAYFVNNGTVFYFTNFYGSQKSLLYHFYLAAYKVTLSCSNGIGSADVYPLQLISNKLSLALQDFTAPFYQFIKLGYQGSCTAVTSSFDTDIVLVSRQYRQHFGNQKQTMDAEVHISPQSIQSFTVNLKGKTTKAQWVPEN